MKRVTEPVRKSLLDVVKKNLRAAGKITYITRVIYIGKYTVSDPKLEESIQSVIENLQTEYDNIPITGVLLVYPDYYIHVLEASEEIIYKHFKNLHKSKTVDAEFGKSIFLPSYPHVHQRFFTQWFHVFTIPPSLFDIPKSYEMDDIQKQMTNCLTKIYRFCDYIANLDRDYSIPMKDVISNLGDQISRVLPESTVIEYLLNAKSCFLFNVENYLETHSKIPFINLYQDSIWPPPHDFMFGDDCGKDVPHSVESTIFQR